VSNIKINAIKNVELEFSEEANKTPSTEDIKIIHQSLAHHQITSRNYAE